MAKSSKTLAIKRTSETDRYIVPSKGGNGGWDIVKHGHRRATGHAKTKSEAIANARSILRREGGGELRIMNRDGKLTDSNTIAPRPTRRK